MDRIVGRDRLVSTSGGGYELVRRPLGNGHVECTVRELVTWHHAGELTDEAYQQYLEAREANAEERHQANLERAAKRAKTRVRHLCKAAGVDTLLTLTYRENMTDWGLLKRHVKEFNRRMARIIPGCFYVAAYERQARGLGTCTWPCIEFRACWSMPVASRSKATASYAPCGMPSLVSWAVTWTCRPASACGRPPASPRTSQST